MKYWNIIFSYFLNFCVCQQSIYNPGAYFESRTVLLPHDEKLKSGGEDSVNVCSTLITIADGFSGWKEYGINAGLYAR